MAGTMSISKAMAAYDVSREEIEARIRKGQLVPSTTIGGGKRLIPVAQLEAVYVPPVVQLPGERETLAAIEDAESRFAARLAGAVSAGLIESGAALR